VIAGAATCGLRCQQAIFHLNDPGRLFQHAGVVVHRFDQPFIPLRRVTLDSAGFGAASRTPPENQTFKKT
jgi:hypothetical protein